MPFELGLACAVAHMNPGYQYMLLERVPYRIQKTLSDVNGRDPYIHGGTIRGTVACILDALRPTRDAPDITDVMRFVRTMSVVATELKRRSGRKTLFLRSTFIDLVATGVVRAQHIGFISP
jgi:hypothetical protein